MSAGTNDRAPGGAARATARPATRLSDASTQKLGLRGRFMFRVGEFFTRRSFARMTGRQPARPLEALELYARLPGFLRAYGSFEQASAKLNHFDWRLGVLAELKAATVIECEFCIDLASQIARHSGLSDEHLLALPRYRDSDLFTDLEKLVMDYAAAISSTPASVPDSLFDQLRQNLDDTALIELTQHIALENMRGRFNVAFGVGAAGYSEGMVCAVPASIGSHQ